MAPNESLNIDKRFFPQKAGNQQIDIVIDDGSLCNSRDRRRDIQIREGAMRLFWSANDLNAYTARCTVRLENSWQSVHCQPSVQLVHTFDDRGFRDANAF